jgi:ABC-type glycerol-3-phosphate transport system permease component
MAIHTQHAPSVRAGSRRRISRARRMSVINTGIVTVLAVLFLWPFLAVVANSFNRMDVRMNLLLPIPTAFTTDYYTMIVTRYGLDQFILNTISVVFTSTIIGTFMCALAGYALAKLEFRGRKTLFVIILAIMLLPTGSMLIPQFVVMRQLHLVNNYWGLILPSVGGNAFGIFLMRQFMLQMPSELLEAGRMDGCSEIGLFIKIVLPNMIAPISVLAILSVSSGWNAVLWPQILISDESKQLIMPAIMRLNNMSSADAFARPVVVSAALVCALLPLGLYLYSQQFFTSTLSGVIKG